MEASQESTLTFNNPSYPAQAQGAILGGPPHTPVTYRDSVYAALESTKKRLAVLENLKLIVDASPALGQTSAQDVTSATYPF